MSQIIFRGDSRNDSAQPPPRIIGKQYEWDIAVFSLTKDSFWTVVPRWIFKLAAVEWNMKDLHPVLYMRNGSKLEGTAAAKIILEDYGII
ncbi:hypothetical protein GGR55DRAFT_679305 [Xylaria sp. FL0064]|nr:hypothetical protein GGR55DRAFT_679305 [Xylaria sp. FL0064]